VTIDIPSGRSRSEGRKRRAAPSSPLAVSRSRSIKKDVSSRTGRGGSRLLLRQPQAFPFRHVDPLDQIRACLDRHRSSELLVKPGIRVSPRTVRRYMPSGSGSKRGPGSQAWSTFVRNHARSVLACDFLVAVTAGFRRLYVFVVLQVGTRRILHWNVTDHPTGEWTAQQFRTVVSGDQPHRFVVHDHDSIYSEGVDRTIAAMGLTVLRTPVRSPQAKAFCERLIGTIRRECVDFLIPLNERQVRRVLAEWVGHYNRGRPHASLGPGIPDPSDDCLAQSSSGHRIRDGHRVVAKPVLGGLHHEYRLESTAA
jgi:putative transposase